METRGLNRLMQLSWCEEPEPRVAVPLLRQHLRLAGRWASALGCEHAWPFFDIAAKVHPPSAAWRHTAQLDLATDAIVVGIWPNV